MLASPASERRTSRNVGSGPQLMSCEAQRDLVFARARQPLNQRQNQRSRPARPTESGFLKPFTDRSKGHAAKSPKPSSRHAHAPRSRTS